MSKRLQKTTVLQRKLLRNIKVQKANNGTITARISVTALLVSLLATCKASPSYASMTDCNKYNDYVMSNNHYNRIIYYINSDSVTAHISTKNNLMPLQANNSKALGGNTGLPLIGGNSISEIFSLISNSDFLTELSKINQLSFFDSFNYVDAVAVNGNNVKQELRKLFKPVQHHTIVDVFLCLPFIFLPVMGELRLAIALLALWWGGYRNKPFIRQILCAVVLRFSSLPAALILGRIIKKLLPLEKVKP